MRILVTGGSGFIGSHLTKKLVELGHEVTITSNGSEPKISGVKKVLHTTMMGVDWEHVKNQDVVFHQAANNDTRCQDMEEMWLANVKAPLKLFQEAYEGGCRRFVFASSTAVYGNEPAPYCEESTKVNPINPYAISKAEFESFAKHFSETHRVAMTGLRYCNVYGPGETAKGKRMSMIGQILREATTPKGIVKLFDHGEQKRDWIYIDDVVRANLLAMERDELDYSVCNIGSGKATSFNDIINIYNDLVEDPDPIDFTINQTNGRLQYTPCPFPEEYQSHTECKMEKAQQLLGFVPEIDIKSGMEKYLRFIFSSYA